LVENRQTGFRELLAELYASGRGAFRVGVTGPPGAGKSTLVDGLAGLLVGEGLSVGVLAVDPTSPFTGGALLGDRVRMGHLATHERAFIRSMATRGSPGGLAAATGDACAVMAAFGFDWLVVETVGVGQIELEVMNVCDAVCAVLVPESGDGIQALKAGLLEMAHVILVNKADRPGADALAAELNLVLKWRRQAGEWSYPVLLTEATNRAGVNRWRSHLEEFRTALSRSGELVESRRRRALAEVESILRERLHAYLASGLPSDAIWPDLAGRLSRGDLDPHGGADLVWESWLKSRPTPQAGES
jgi:LAO/AO transport system kinase